MLLPSLGLAQFFQFFKKLVLGKISQYRAFHNFTKITHKNCKICDKKSPKDSNIYFKTFKKDLISYVWDCLTKISGSL